MLHRIALWVTLTLVSGIAVNSFAIERVPGRMNYLEIRSGYAMPLGDYTGLPGVPFVDQDGFPVSIEGTNVYKDGVSFGVGYGQVFGGKWIAGASFEYARNAVKDPIIQPGFAPVSFPKESAYNHYAIVLNWAYAPLDLRDQSWSPYFGPSVSLGLASLSAPGYVTEYQTDFGLDLAFGMDFRVWQSADNRSMVALSSINSWNFVATSDRVSHLQIGGGLKYFFKP